MLRSTIALTLALLGAPVASAQTSDQDERARVHFESGRAYFEEGAYERALQEFEQAYELSPRTVMLFNLGTTYERLGRLEEAAASFEQYLREGTEIAPQERSLLERRVENLRRRIAQREAGEPEDDPIDEGGGGASAEPTPSAGGGGGDGLIIAGAVGLGVAGVGLALTGVFGALALSAESSVQDGCFATSSCTPDDVADIDTFRVAADVSWISAAALGAAGLVLLIVGLTAGGDDDAQASVRFTGAGVEGSF